MDKLKPCPWCGNPHVYIEKYLTKWSVVCPVYACPRIFQELFDTEADAIGAWNSMEREDKQ